MAGKSPITLCGSLARYPAPLGAAMHRAGYAALGLSFTYVPFAVTDLRGAIAGMRALGIRGLGIAVPFKIEVMALLDKLDPLAERIGAVNTVVNDDGVLTGYNADAGGAVGALEEATAIAKKRVLMVGAGGAARAVAYAFKEKGAVLHIVNRTAERAAALAALVGATSGGLGDAENLDRFDIVVNCSAAGMQEYGAASPIPARSLRPALVVMDIVYKPVATELIAAARAAGATTVHGGRMLLHQALRQFELYTGRPAPMQVMDAALNAQIGASG
jgi:shikimate dehydrogenase